MTYRIGVDIGGTFTDCVVVGDDGQMGIGKTPTTPDDFTHGFFASIADASEQLGLAVDDLLAQSQTVVHATTVGSNAVVERSGAKVGLLATKGHGESIAIMRGGGRAKGLGVHELLDVPGTSKPAPIVPHTLVREVTERVDRDGHVLIAPADDEIEGRVRELLDAGAEALAIAFLWSFLWPEHERRARAIVESVAPGTFVSCSHEVAPQIGEYYRTVATVMNAYLGPLMRTYVGEIVDGAKERGYERAVLFAQCIGGSDRVEAIQRTPLLTLDSGPVSGVVASQFLGEVCGYSNIITADMGGTTLDVCVLPAGEPERRETTILNRYEMYLPMVNVESIGAGGGSIAWIDPANGGLRVGPRSAGASPGPVCYGRGGKEPTVTDADLVLGVLNPETFLRGRGGLDAGAAHRAIAALGSTLGLATERVAAGIAEIVESGMAEQIRRMTVGRGHDPREFTLFSFGGAAGAHSAAIAAELGISEVIVPLGDMASVFSAMGTVAGDVTQVHDRSVRYGEPFDKSTVAEVFAELRDAALSGLARAGFAESDVVIRSVASIKYAAQVYDLEIQYDDDISAAALIERFEAEYARQFGAGTGYRDAGIEIMRQRVYAAGKVARLEIARNGDEPDTPPATPAGTRDIWWASFGDSKPTPVYQAEHLSVGMDPIAGPAIVDLPDTTVVVRPDDVLEVDRYGNLRIRVGAGDRAE